MNKIIEGLKEILEKEIETLRADAIAAKKAALIGKTGDERKALEKEIQQLRQDLRKNKPKLKSQSKKEDAKKKETKRVCILCFNDFTENDHRISLNTEETTESKLVFRIENSFFSDESFILTNVQFKIEVYSLKLGFS